MSKLKGLSAVILVSLFLISIGSCGGGSGNNKSSGNANTTITIPTLITDTTGNVKTQITGSTQLSVTVRSLSGGTMTPLSGMKVDVVTDKTNYYILLSDPTGAISPIPITFNINDISSKTQQSITGRAPIRTSSSVATCGLQAMENILDFAISIVGNGIEVVADILNAKDILSAVISAPVAIESTANFHPLQDISHGGIYLCRCTLDGAMKELQAKVNLTSGMITLSSIALPTVGEIAGVLLSTSNLFTQMQSVVYCLYGYNDNYIFDWSWVNGVLTPTPVEQGYSISGRVTSSGNGLSEITIALTGSVSTSTTTDSNGNYTFTGLQNGSYTITSSLTGYSFSPPNISVTINNTDIVGQNFVATPTAFSPPSITSVSPNPVTGSSTQQTITLTGSNFQSGLTVTVSWTGGSKVLSSSQVIVDSSSQVRIFITTTTTPDNWWVKVTNPDGQSSNTINFSVVGLPPTADTTPPTVPTGLTATAVSSSEIDLSWNASTDDVGVAGYKVYRNRTLITMVSTTSASDTGLSPNIQYCYTISAYDAAGNDSGQSSQACALTKPSNQNPIISSVTPATCPYTGGSTTVMCDASDPDGDPLTYSWTATGGSISGSGATITWTAPNAPVGSSYTITCTVSDGRGGSASQGTNILICGGGEI